ncbi:replication protein A 32 kDa subunit B-like isoform X2 [Magnolia sinica]|uniref:replication protein A 32 kDa subunit B-like isoform X2 n=1 Tax=Magnolia sinica TaxID=86752 RepID=UPI00265983E2|nr:replication protein A 32 kDa subunit B-like isoform X2 [Magnolia sinica]
MYSSQFDGASVFSGGGFMPSQATQAPDSAFSPARNRGNQCLLPLTMKQISDAYQMTTNPISSLDSVDVNHVTLLGLVMNKVEKVTDVNFSLDDGTGRIDVHRWVNDEGELNEMAGIMNGMYVRVHGQLKGFQGKKHAVAFSVRPVTDFNEIAYHFIQCMYVHKYNLRIQGGGQAQPQTNPGMYTPFQNRSYGHQVAVSNRYSSHVSIAESGGNFDQMVLAIFLEPKSLARESGIHVDEIVQQLGVPRNKVMASINYHANNGNIYSTIDDCHFKSTFNG